MFAFSFENFNPRKEDSYFLRVPLSRSLQLPVHLHKKNLWNSTLILFLHSPTSRSSFKIKHFPENFRSSDSLNVRALCSRYSFSLANKFTGGSLHRWGSVREREKRWILCFVVARLSRPRRMSKIKMPWQSFASAYISLSMHVDHP